MLLKGIHWCRDAIVSKADTLTATSGTESFFARYISVFIFIMIPIAALVTWLSFYKRKYNYWEHFLANTYIAAMLNIVLLLIHLLGLLILFFSGGKMQVNLFYYIIPFMMVFFYLYGAVWGRLMHPWYKKLQLSLILTGMNTALAILYFSGFAITGILKL